MRARENPAGSASGQVVDDPLVSRTEADPDAAAEFEDSGNRARLLWNLVRIRKLRRPRIGQRLIAERMGTTQSVVSELEQGITDPRLSALQRYARAFGCRIELIIVDVSDGNEKVVWRSRIRFKTWRGRALPYNHGLLPVRIEKDPQKIWGSKLGIRYSNTTEHRWEPQWKGPARSRHILVNDVSVTAEPDDFLRAVTRG